ncbi:YgiQ family radical SAM protein [Quatrionicoccus australiensis]|uniref:YgiQ family radical SAM protein n=1 Tax=Quatrionicoccus australiensis TaxID=138118 RepID=UPI001CF7F3A4|nr:YgiQ family radical SAM protein [Quatrionicoccus australiensis]UCV16823.1 YgiQ family radical SAM protein [Quatrionicoccus australiensis]
MSRAEMDVLGWDSCDIILVTGDAYIDHPSFGMALVGRLLEAQGFRVGIICQPDWNSAADFKKLGKPNLYFGVTAGNMDSMVNRYTSDRKIRSDDAYTPNGEANKRPDHAVTVYAQRCREAFPGSNIVIGSIEASLRRIAHYDYWSDKVRRSVLPDSKADILIFGNAERALVELTHRLAKGEPIKEIRDLRGTAFMVPIGWLPSDDWNVMDSSEVDTPGPLVKHADPYAMDAAGSRNEDSGSSKGGQPLVFSPKSSILDPQARREARRVQRAHTVVRLPAYERVKDDPVLYAHASRTFHLESNPGNARALVQAHGERDVWLNPPPIPLTTEELDGVYELPYARRPHPSYGEAKIPAWEMIRFSVNIMRGCFGGCTFCSITEHEGRIIQSRSEESVLREIEEMRDKTPGFTGIVSDLGGPTANMYHLKCKDEKIEASCRRLSCVYPDICENLGTDHSKLISLYRKARTLKGVKKVLIGSGLRYDLAVRSPEYIKELVTHHVGGYLKIAPEHTEEGPLSKMMKPGMGAYDRFKQLFDRFSREAGKEQYLIPYFIAAHPGTTDEDMLNLALWLKKNNFRLDQVQTFLPTPMALATTMYHSERNPLRKVSRSSEQVGTVRNGRQRKLHKAFLRYHDPANWPLLREALKEMGRADLIGNGKKQLIPAWQPAGTGDAPRGQPAKMVKNQPGALPRRAESGHPARPGAPSRPLVGRKPVARKPR